MAVIILQGYLSWNDRNNVVGVNHSELNIPVLKFKVVLSAIASLG
jgi:hypothetical protein